MLAPEFIERLQQHDCPICGGNIRYDQDNNCLVCDSCRNFWNYTEYKLNKLAYDNDYDTYTALYNHEKFDR